MDDGFTWTCEFTCACGCGRKFRTNRWHDKGSEHYASAACKQRVYRRRVKARKAKAKKR